MVQTAAAVVLCGPVPGHPLKGSSSPDSLRVPPPFKSGAPLVREATSTIGFTGFYRFLGFVRDQKETFPNNSGKTTAILVGDAYREPMLLLKMNGRTQEGIGFGADFVINSVYKGPEAQFTQPLTLELGLNLRADLDTEFGDFSFRSGGMLVSAESADRLGEPLPQSLQLV